MTRNTPTPPTVAILLCTYNGSRYLDEQLASFADQTLGDWQLHVSDDGSTDGTLERLREHPGVAGRLHVYEGPRLGSGANFMSLACRDGIAARHYAFSDQDDRWHPDKLARAVAALEETPAGVPALYGSRTVHVDGQGTVLRLSPMYARVPEFATALVQNLAGGNTMVMNQAAMDLVRRAGPVRVMVHDWWFSMLVTGAGGRVILDERPSLDYRQHTGNVIGGSAGPAKRLHSLLAGRFRSWNEMNVAALQQARPLLTPQARRMLDDFAAARQAGLPRRLLLLRRSGVRRQTPGGNLALWAAALFGRI